MTLADYIAYRGIPIARFGERVGVNKRQTMWKYVKNLTVPPREIQERIAIETGGLVLPEDFKRAGKAA